MCFPAVRETLLVMLASLFEIQPASFEAISASGFTAPLQERVLYFEWFVLTPLSEETQPI